MSGSRIRLTAAQAIVRYLTAQHIETNAGSHPLFAGVFAIFGHGNVTSLGEALAGARAALPVWRGQNEQSMALSAAAFAKATRRQQIMVATSSIGPGASNMLTAAALAHVNRLPVLFLAGDSFASRAADPVLQQLEHPHDPSLNVNDAFKAAVNYWDRIVRPEQVIGSLPRAVTTMLDPARCGPVFIGLAQDAQAEAFSYPASLFEDTIHRIPRPRPDDRELGEAVRLIEASRRPLIIVGGGVRYSQAETALSEFAQSHQIPVAETVAGRASLPWDHPMNVGPIGVIGSNSANALAAHCDLVLAIGTKLQDFTTGSWTIFRDPSLRIVGLNTVRMDATKHRSIPLVGDALVTILRLNETLGPWKAPQDWVQRAEDEYQVWNNEIDTFVNSETDAPPSYAQVVRAVNKAVDDRDVVVAAAGGIPGELNKVWRAREPGTYDLEFGYSCMGYEIAGGLGVKMADPSREVVVLLGDGSYLMLNSELYTSVATGFKLLVVLCDNSGFAVIDRLQREKGSPPYNNMLEGSGDTPTVDFEAHARSLGATSERVETADELEAAVRRARSFDRSHVIVIRTDPRAWAPGGAWWDVGVPETSEFPDVMAAKELHEQGRRHQAPSL